MAYEFASQPIASVKLGAFNMNRTMTLNQVNGTITNAGTIVDGIKGLLYIANVHGAEDYYPNDTVRILKQNVRETE